MQIRKRCQKGANITRSMRTGSLRREGKAYEIVLWKSRWINVLLQVVTVNSVDCTAS